MRFPKRFRDWDISSAELRRIGARIHTIKKLFNVREGWQPKDDWLPERLLSENLPTGISIGAGVGLSPDELLQMIQSYYQARGWDDHGYIPESTLAELDLSQVASAVESCAVITPAGGLRQLFS